MCNNLIKCCAPDNTRCCTRKRLPLVTPVNKTQDPQGTTQLSYSVGSRSTRNSTNPYPEARNILAHWSKGIDQSVRQNKVSVVLNLSVSSEQPRVLPVLSASHRSGEFFDGCCAVVGAKVGLQFCVGRWQVCTGWSSWFQLAVMVLLRGSSWVLIWLFRALDCHSG